MAGGHEVFLSYSHNDLDAAVLLRAQLERAGLSVFKDDKSIREGDLLLWCIRCARRTRRCVRPWIGAETQVALNSPLTKSASSDSLRL